MLPLLQVPASRHPGIRKPLVQDVFVNLQKLRPMQDRFGVSSQIESNGPRGKDSGALPVSLDRATMERCTVSFFRRGWPTLPDIRLVECAGVHLIVKDWRKRSPLRRLTQGRFMLGREYWFLKHLEGVAGIPRAWGFPDADSLAIESLAGQPVSAVHPHEYVQGYWDRLDALVRTIHSRGVAHGDLDQEDNILVLPDGSPAIIDFGGAVASCRFSPLHVLLYDLLARHDLHCVERLRAKKDLYPDQRRAAPPPQLFDWQRRLLVFFRKMERMTDGRTHGVGEAR